MKSLAKFVLVVGIVAFVLYGWLGATKSAPKPETPAAEQADVVAPEPLASPSGSIDDAASTVQPTQSYSDGLRVLAVQRYLQRRAAYLDQIRYIYFAVGCNVLYEGADVQALIFTLKREAFEASQDMWQVDGYNVKREQVTAQQDGLALAAKSGACNYWHQNREVAQELREQTTRSIY